MNIIDIGILIILAVSVIYGLYKGFLHTVLSLACCLISLAVAFACGPMLSEIISGRPGVSASLATYTDAVARVGDWDLAATPVDQLSQSAIDQVLGSVHLPESISKVLQSNLESRAFAGTGLTTVNDYVSNTVVRAAVNVLSYIACYALSFLVLSMIVNLIHHVFQLPLLKQLDWLAGGAFGLVRGAMIVYVLFLLLPIFSTVVPLPQFDALLSQSALAPVFQSNGFIASVIAGR